MNKLLKQFVLFAEEKIANKADGTQSTYFELPVLKVSKPLQGGGYAEENLPVRVYIDADKNGNAYIKVNFKHSGLPARRNIQAFISLLQEMAEADKHGTPFTGIQVRGFTPPKAESVAVAEESIPNG